MSHPDVCIAGAGIIGLSLALHLHDLGLSVAVLDRSAPLTEASTAAAGMLAVDDPDNPPELHPLSHLSRSLYPAFLDRLHDLSSRRVPFQTASTLQALPPHAHGLHPLSPSHLHDLLPSLHHGPHTFARLDEVSLDPRDLASALLAAVPFTSIELRPHTPALHLRSTAHAVVIQTPTGPVHAAHFVDCTGAWNLSAPLLPQLPITPRKGQMLSVRLPPSLPLDSVLRTPEIYIVPRTIGPAAGRAIIGATVEDAGFDKSVLPSAIAALQAQAAILLPPLADAEILESWSGLRPSTPDRLPLLGDLSSRSDAGPGLHLIASGHFRNGILLAPATARILADLLTGHPPALDLTPFSPLRTPPHPLPWGRRQ